MKKYIVIVTENQLLVNSLRGILCDYYVKGIGLEELEDYFERNLPHFIVWDLYQVVKDDLSKIKISKYSKHSFLKTVYFRGDQYNKELNFSGQVRELSEVIESFDLEELPKYYFEKKVSLNLNFQGSCELINEWGCAFSSSEMDISSGEILEADFNFLESIGVKKVRVRRRVVNKEKTATYYEFQFVGLTEEELKIIRRNTLRSFPQVKRRDMYGE